MAKLPATGQKKKPKCVKGTSCGYACIKGGIQCRDNVKAGPGAALIKAAKGGKGSGVKPSELQAKTSNKADKDLSTEELKAKYKMTPENTKKETTDIGGGVQKTKYTVTAENGDTMDFTMVTGRVSNVGNAKRGIYMVDTSGNLVNVMGDDGTTNGAADFAQTMALTRQPKERKPRQPKSKEYTVKDSDIEEFDKLQEENLASTRDAAKKKSLSKINRAAEEGLKRGEEFWAKRGQKPFVGQDRDGNPIEYDRKQIDKTLSDLKGVKDPQQAAEIARKNGIPENQVYLKSKKKGEWGTTNTHQVKNPRQLRAEQGSVPETAQETLKKANEANQSAEATVNRMAETSARAKETLAKANAPRKVSEPKVETPKESSDTDVTPVRPKVQTPRPVDEDGIPLARPEAIEEPSILKKSTYKAKDPTVEETFSMRGGYDRLANSDFSDTKIENDLGGDFPTHYATFTKKEADEVVTKLNDPNLSDGEKQDIRNNTRVPLVRDKKTNTWKMNPMLAIPPNPKFGFQRVLNEKGDLQASIRFRQP